MSLTRAEAAGMRDCMLVIASDRLRGRLRKAWDRGQPGSLTDLYDLAVIYAESVLRGVPLPSPMLPGQLTLDIAGCSDTELQELL